MPAILPISTDALGRHVLTSPKVSAISTTTSAGIATSGDLDELSFDLTFNDTDAQTELLEIFSPSLKPAKTAAAHQTNSTKTNNNNTYTTPIPPFNLTNQFTNDDEYENPTSYVTLTSSRRPQKKILDNEHEFAYFLEKLQQPRLCPSPFQPNGDNTVTTDMRSPITNHESTNSIKYEYLDIPPCDTPANSVATSMMSPSSLLSRWKDFQLADEANSVPSSSPITRTDNPLAHLTTPASNSPASNAFVPSASYSSSASSRLPFLRPQRYH